MTPSKLTTGNGAPGVPAMTDSCLLCALENISSGVFAVDIEGNVVFFNKAAENITGFRSEQILGGHYSEFPFAATGGRPGLFDDLLSSGKWPDGKTERMVGCSDGRSVPVESLLRPVRDESGEIVGALEIFNDLSALKELRDEVSKSRTLSALGEMSANVAHEIRNPLGSIGGFAALLERDLDDDDPRRNLVKKIIEGVASLDRIVTNLLIYTRPLKADLKRTDLIGYVNEVLAFLEVEIESQSLPIRLERKFPSRSLGAMIDPNLMQQVLLNIFRNAVHAMRDEGGKMTISLRRASENGGSGRGRAGRKEMVELLVADEGVGMNEEVQQKIFNPFFTTREDGTGLGLAISKKMIQEQNGSIRVSSTPGRGTEIMIILPYCP